MLLKKFWLPVENMLLKKFNKLITPWNILILSILCVAFFLRVYRIGDLLDFHYDQGRDAMVIWNLWHQHKLFLIGPTTGLDGIFLGPFYYYLIAPFYLIGKGNPIYPSIFLSLLVTISSFVLYKTGELIGNKKLGLIALVISTFSYYLIASSRWLSNPTPIFLTSSLIFYLMAKIVKKERVIYWYVLYLLIGISMHFESASAAFYIPMVLVFTFLKRKKLTWKTFFVSGFLLFLTFTPQLIFDIKHGNILIKNILHELPKQEQNSSPISRILTDRFKLFWGMFSTKLFQENNKLALGFSLLSLSGILLSMREKKYKEILKLFLIFIGIPLICYTFYRGNHGLLYDYYFTGYYLILILIFSFGLWVISNLKFGNIILAVFLVLFLTNNAEFTKRRLTLGVSDGQDIFISNQLQAIDWINKDAGDDKFNVDVYVPPVIPHSYNYLFTYRGDKRSDDATKKLYTLYEIDPPHPERLQAWLDRQKVIGKVVEEVKFGGITVQRRDRIKYDY